MAVDDFFGKKWSDRSTGGKALYAGAVAAGGWAIPVANEIGKMWKGDTGRLDEINAQAAELENSEFNTAKLTQQNEDYYDQVFMNAAKAQRAAEFGLTPEQKAEAKQGFSENTNLAMQNAQNAGGGNLANYINANMNTNANKFATNLSAQDQAVKMQKEQQVLNYLSMLGNAAGNSQDVFSQNFNKNMMAEQAIGQAEKDWYTQRDTNRMGLVNAGASAVGQVGAAVATGGASAAAGGGGGAAAPASPTYTPPPSPYNPNWMNSDIRLKENIVYSHSENGYNIYNFNYKDSPSDRYSGVMAQEVLEKDASAVMLENGFYKVHYDKLGLTMKKLN